MWCYISSCLSSLLPTTISRFFNFTDTRGITCLRITGHIMQLHFHRYFPLFQLLPFRLPWNKEQESLRSCDILISVHHLFVFHFMNPTYNTPIWTLWAHSPQYTCEISSLKVQHTLESFSLIAFWCSGTKRTNLGIKMWLAESERL